MYALSLHCGRTESTMSDEYVGMLFATGEWGVIVRYYLYRVIVQKIDLSRGNNKFCKKVYVYHRRYETTNKNVLSQKRKFVLPQLVL